MTEYDYSPGAWEAHLAKQAHIAKWTLTAAQATHNPFKPTDEELARLKASGFYKQTEGGTRMYGGPDRPPSPGGPPVGSGMKGTAYYYQYPNTNPANQPMPSGPSGSSGSGTSTPVSYTNNGGQQQQPIYLYPGQVAHVPVYNPVTRQYDWKKYEHPDKVGRRRSPRRTNTGITSDGGGSSVRPKPTRSATMPAFYSPSPLSPPLGGGGGTPSSSGVGGKQQQQYAAGRYVSYTGVAAQQPLNSGSTVTSGSGVSMGYAYAYPGVPVVEGAPKRGKKLRKEREG
ncbi:hypothetical protein NMY22_g10842 [Coprinellus aureogranulatus]|nr:hypothetical protein NMY22_g10842 [Coprinellus aureogranulatus]